ncbi:hypothetical protein XA68_10818 [Ophiocordyceps unilateralis]|uniref:Uncharacterized protein n=1 Tax=Ophiocordyceps unilateralis TaxID=268505 RepID=A0A2A9P2G8_OPHUN|nr:hypothetical protein XA68_10818 [Ophiocordyceps unilateralis]
MRTASSSWHPASRSGFTTVVTQPATISSPSSDLSTKEAGASTSGSREEEEEEEEGEEEEERSRTKGNENLPPVPVSTTVFTPTAGGSSSTPLQKLDGHEASDVVPNGEMSSSGTGLAPTNFSGIPRPTAQNSSDDGDKTEGSSTHDGVFSKLSAWAVDVEPVIATKTITGSDATADQTTISHATAVNFSLERQTIPLRSGMGHIETAPSTPAKDDDMAKTRTALSTADLSHQASRPAPVTPALSQSISSEVGSQVSTASVNRPTGHFWPPSSDMASGGSPGSSSDTVREEPSVLLPGNKADDGSSVSPSRTVPSMPFSSTADGKSSIWSSNEASDESEPSRKGASALSSSKQPSAPGKKPILLATPTESSTHPGQSIGFSMSSLSSTAVGQSEAPALTRSLYSKTETAGPWPAEMTTETRTYTVSSCAPIVTNCPVGRLLFNDVVTAMLNTADGTADEKTQTTMTKTYTVARCGETATSCPLDNFSSDVVVFATAVVDKAVTASSRPAPTSQPAHDAVTVTLTRTMTVKSCGAEAQDCSFNEAVVVEMTTSPPARQTLTLTRTVTFAEDQTAPTHTLMKPRPDGQSLTTIRTLTKAKTQTMTSAPVEDKAAMKMASAEDEASVAAPTKTITTHSQDEQTVTTIKRILTTTVTVTLTEDPAPASTMATLSPNKGVMQAITRTKTYTMTLTDDAAPAPTTAIEEEYTMTMTRTLTITTSRLPGSPAEWRPSVQESVTTITQTLTRTILLDCEAGVWSATVLQPAVETLSGAETVASPTTTAALERTASFTEGTTIKTLNKALATIGRFSPIGDSPAAATTIMAPPPGSRPHYPPSNLPPSQAIAS